MIVTNAPMPAEVVATLTCTGTAVEPTERWAPGWSAATVTANANVYGLYARMTPMVKWLDPSVRDLLGHYPGEVGGGTLPPGFDVFVVPDTEVEGLGPWVLMYVGRSLSPIPRMKQYFGSRDHLSRRLGGQSLHLTLSLMFGGTVDPRVSLPQKATSVENVLRGSLSLTLEHRFRDMRLSYVQVETAPCDCSPCVATCLCKGCSERALLRDRTLPPPPNGWPAGARPLINSQW